MRGCLAALAVASTITAVAAAPPIAPDQVLDVATGDWNRDGRLDVAMIAVTDRDEMDIGLYVYFRDERDPEFGLLELALAVPDALWGDDNRPPTIRGLENGSIALTERNFAIGREHWELTRTVAWRGGAFVVAGYRFDYRDTLQEYEPLNCELNLLTGKGVVDGRAVTFEPTVLALQDWKVEAGEDPGRRICKRF